MEPMEVIVEPACDAHGASHMDYGKCEEHGWGLVDPTEDDSPILETPYKDVAEYVAALINKDFNVKAAKA